MANTPYSLPDAIRELRELQKVFFDHASTYTKLVLGLGYGGFLTAWSGTKAYLSPGYVLWSVLLITTSLLLFIVYEIAQIYILSRLSWTITGTQAHSDAEIIQMQQHFSAQSASAFRKLVPAWKVIFPTCVATGLLGAGIMICGFVAAIYKMY